VRDLRKLIAENGRLPIENLRLVLRGNVLHDSKNGDNLLFCSALSDMEEHFHCFLDSLIVAVKPKTPAKYVRDGEDEDDDDLVNIELMVHGSKWAICFQSMKRVSLFFLLKLPDVLLISLFSISLKLWAVIVIWFMLAPVAHRWDLGPLYILGTGFAIIFYNLGQRQHGDMSAYSIFNEDFRELPGTLNADRLDRDIRAGQL
ncbi:hypothetical protein RJ640_029821, partial [Escallonia rubra]